VADWAEIQRLASCGGLPGSWPRRTRRLRRLAKQAGVKLPRMHPHMLRHTFVTTMAGCTWQGVAAGLRAATDVAVM
jgi:integrase